MTKFRLQALHTTRIKYWNAGKRPPGPNILSPSVNELFFSCKTESFFRLDFTAFFLLINGFYFSWSLQFLVPVPSLTRNNEYVHSFSIWRVFSLCFWRAIFFHQKRMGIPIILKMQWIFWNKNDVKSFYPHRSVLIASTWNFLYILNTLNKLFRSNYLDQILNIAYILNFCTT